MPRQLTPGEPIARLAAMWPLLLAAPIGAQGAGTPVAAAPGDLPSVAAGWDVARPQPHEPTLTLRLDRPLHAASDGRLAVIVGRTDVSALLDVRGTTVRLPLRGEPLPDGDLQVEAYLVRGDGTWRELGRFALRRRTRRGFDSAAVRPRLDAQLDGQLGAHFPAGAPPPPRGRAWQDLTLNGGIESALRRGAVAGAGHVLVVGVPREQARLRAAQLGPRAPAVDLAAYDLRLARGRVSLSAGHLAVGRDRLLASQFRSRGVGVGVDLGRVARLDLASVAGAEPVGWENPLGLSRPAHRVQSASLGVEALPRRPGVLRVELSALDGARQPLPAFTQQAATDREWSRGVGWSVAAALPSQRARLAVGSARSRFGNPVDPLLSGDTTVVSVRPETRDARYAELTVDALRGAAIGRLATSMQLTVRHERVDPLYRSVAAAVAADQRQEAIEATGTLGALQLQGTVTRAHDNLARVPTLLLTRTRTRALAATLPVGALLRAAPAAWWWPQLTAQWQAHGQRGDAIPDSAGFRFPFQRPDQWSENATFTAAWQRATWNVAWRANRSTIDNRQAERERSDFRTLVHAVTVGAVPSPRLTLGVDLSDEVTRSRETATRARTTRAALQADWRPLSRTTLGGAWSFATSDDPAATRRGRNDELRVELSRGVDLYRRSADGAQARAFLRFARTGAASRVAGALQPDVDQWTLAAGFNVRFL